MLTLKVSANGDGAFQEYANITKNYGKVVHIAGLANGMASGEPSVGLVIQFPNGKYAMGETSLQLLIGAVDVLKIKYGL